MTDPGAPDPDSLPGIDELTDDATKRETLIVIAAKGNPIIFKQIQDEMTWSELLRFVSAERAINYRPKKPND